MVCIGDGNHLGRREPSTATGIKNSNGKKQQQAVLQLQQFELQKQQTELLKQQAVLQLQQFDLQKKQTKLEEKKEEQGMTKLGPVHRGGA